MNRIPAHQPYRWFVAGFALAMAIGFLTSAAPVSANHAAVPGRGATQLGPDLGTQAVTAGIDVNRWNNTVNWTSVHGAGVEFAYLKATEGTSTKDPNFNTYYPAAYYAGLVRGAYHIGLPNLSSGTVQADYFASNGGAWSADNQTLPGALDLEPNPYSGGYCYGLSQSSMVSWISAFANEYHARTGRWAVIGTTLSWWKLCTGNYSGFATRHPLWIVRWSTSAGTLPAGWSFFTFWQDTNCRKVSGISGCADGDYFNGDRTRLVALADNA